MKRLVLLDRDGTINVERHYLSSPSQVELLPNAAEGIRLMHGLGCATVVVTNQSGVGRGYFSADALNRIHERLCELLAEYSASPHAIYVCPHHPDLKCSCRKPQPGLAREAADEFQADLSRSFVIGDNVCDIELGRRVGATTILVCTGYGRQVLQQNSIQPDYVVGDLLDAGRVIQKLIGNGSK